MFKSGQANPYDEVVVKTTDENLTGENWELILTLCDKVVDEGEAGARNVVAALLRRLAHRNPNVQLYALSLAESLSKNCGIELHRELSSRSFTQALEKIVGDRTTHDRVKRRTLALVAMWTEDFKDNPSLGVMEECYNNLKAKNYRFDQPAEAPPPQVDDELRRKEEEELQRVLEMSMHDKGGRTGAWKDYSAAAGASSSGAGGSGSSSSLPIVPPLHSEASAASTQPPGVPRPTSSYANPNSPSNAQNSQHSIGTDTPAPVQAQPTVQVTRVRALHTFTPTEPGELSFDKGDIIKVVDRNYKDWWRGQLRGRTGIFPVNYVEPLPELTGAEIAREAEMEAAVFQQASDVEKLLNMLRSFESGKESLADNEEIQELYRSSMSLRPRIVKLIDKYNQKKAELVLMNESFIKAKTIFERMMEESLARHTSEYGGVPIIQQPQLRPGQDAFAAGQTRASVYGWNPSVYDQSAQGAGFSQYGASPYQGPAQEYPYQPAPVGVASPYGPPPQGSQLAYQQPEPAYQPQPTPQVGASYPGQQISGPGQSIHPQSQPTPAPDVSYAAQPQAQHQQLPGYQQQQQPQNQPQSQPQPHAPSQNQPAQVQPSQVLAQTNGQTAAQPDSTNGPPYDYDPNGTYPDPGAQAWALYYAQGGTDPAGAVYFKFVPGITELTSQHGGSGSQQPAGEQPAQSGTQTQLAADNSASGGYTQAVYGGASSYQPSTGGGAVTSPGSTVPQSAQPAVTSPTDQVPEGSQMPAIYPAQQQYPVYGNYSQPSHQSAVQAHSPIQQMNHQFSAMSVGTGDTIAPQHGPGSVAA